MGRVGILLAGGGGRRLRGGAAAAAVRKEAVAVGGRALVEWVHAALAPEVDDVVLVTTPEAVLPRFARPVVVVHDTSPGSGPLAAIADGLGAAGRGAVAAGRVPPEFAVIASCDVPLLKPAVVRLLLDEAVRSGADWTVPLVGGHLQVLVSVMRPALAGPLGEWLAAGHRDVRGLVTRLESSSPGAVRVVAEPGIAAVDPGLESFLDVDTPADLERVRRQLLYGPAPRTSYTPPP